MQGWLEDEYELKQRAEVLTRKLTVVSDTANTLAGGSHSIQRALVEVIIVLLIAIDIVVGVYHFLAIVILPVVCRPTVFWLACGYQCRPRPIPFDSPQLPYGDQLPGVGTEIVQGGRAT